jgi:hypothetical protein
MFINREYNPMINKFLIESFADKITEENIKESRFYKKYDYSKKLTESVKSYTGLHSDTISSFLEKRKKKIKTFFDLEASPVSTSIEIKIEALQFILEGFDFEHSTNAAARDKVIKRHNKKYLNLLFESGLSESIDQNDDIKKLLSKTSPSFSSLTNLDEDEFSDLANRAKHLKQLMKYHVTLPQEIIDCMIIDIEASKEEAFVTEFGEYNFMISNRIIQMILKYDASKELGTTRVRQLKTLRQKAEKFKIQIKKTEGSKFTDMNIKDLLTTTKKREAYKTSVHLPILSNIKSFINK